MTAETIAAMTVGTIAVTIAATMTVTTTIAMMMTVTMAATATGTRAFDLLISVDIAKVCRPAARQQMAAIATATRTAIGVGETRRSFDGHIRTATTVAIARLDTATAMTGMAATTGMIGMTETTRVGDGRSK